MEYLPEYHDSAGCDRLELVYDDRQLETDPDFDW